MQTRYGLIGEKLGHSFSVPIHNMLGNTDYCLCEVAKDNLHTFMESHDFNAINVTIPYKTDVIEHLCYISDEAKRIGAVNTIVNHEGNLYGYNTDYYGFSYMAKKAGITFNGKKVIILGSGGTSLTSRTVAADEGAKEIVIISRNGKNNYSNISLHNDADIIINTTPVGMFPKTEDTPISLKGFKNLSGVIDVIYNPIRTKLLVDAKVYGIPYTNGLPMLVAQAKKAHELFFDTIVNDSEIDRITKKLELQKQNIILIGMPGCGKSTLAAALSEKLGRDIIDTDEEIVKTEGTSIPHIFEHNGEKYFRETEALCIKKACAEFGKIIATGGGAILKEENRTALMQSGLVIWLKRPLEELARSGRPLSKDIESLNLMYNKRLPLYEKTCDITFDIRPSAEESLHELLKCIF